MRKVKRDHKMYLFLNQRKCFTVWKWKLMKVAYCERQLVVILLPVLRAVFYTDRIIQLGRSK